MLRACIIVFTLLFATASNAASRFWVGGTGTWDSSTTTNWAATTGGVGGQSVPSSADTVTFDASSGGGTVTVNFGGLITVQSITAGAFTGTLDFSANNNSVTVTAISNSINFSGSGTRTINLGNGTWTLSGVTGNWEMTTVTNLTFNANSSTVVFSGTGTQLFNHGGKNFSTVTFGARSGAGHGSLNGNGHTIATLNITAPNIISLDTNVTTTITNAMTLVGTSSQPIYLYTTGTATMSFATNSTCSWCAIRGMLRTGAGTFVASNSFDLQTNTGITFTGPSAFGSGGSCILGGWLLWRDLPEHLNDNFPAWLEKAG